MIVIVPKCLLSPVPPLRGRYLVGDVSRGPGGSAQVQPPPLLLDLVQGRPRLQAAGGLGLLGPVVHQPVEVFGERALLDDVDVVVAVVVGLDPGEPRDSLGRRGRRRGRGEQRLRLIGGRLSRGRALG